MTQRRDDGARRMPTRRAHEKESPRAAQVLAGRADRGLWWALLLRLAVLYPTAGWFYLNAELASIV